MIVQIWDIKRKQYITKQKVQFIAVSTVDNTFKLDDTYYKKEEYELDYIHSEG